VGTGYPARRRTADAHGNDHPIAVNDSAQWLPHHTPIDCDDPPHRLAGPATPQRPRPAASYPASAQGLWMRKGAPGRVLRPTRWPLPHRGAQCPTHLHRYDRMHCCALRQESGQARPPAPSHREGNDVPPRGGIRPCASGDVVPLPPRHLRPACRIVLHILTSANSGDGWEGVLFGRDTVWVVNLPSVRGHAVRPTALIGGSIEEQI
jgi:hypothetical protein